MKKINKVLFCTIALTAINMSACGSDSGGATSHNEGKTVNRGDYDFDEKYFSIKSEGVLRLKDDYIGKPKLDKKIGIPSTYMGNKIHSFDCYGVSFNHLYFDEGIDNVDIRGENIESIYFPSTLKYLNMGIIPTVYYSPKIKEMDNIRLIYKDVVTLPPNLEKIKGTLFLDNADNNFDDDTEDVLNWPKSLTYINNLYLDHLNVKTFSVPQSIKIDKLDIRGYEYIKTINMKNANYDFDYDFSGCKNLETVILSNCVTNLNCFYQCPNLTNLVFSKNIKKFNGSYFPTHILDIDKEANIFFEGTYEDWFTDDLNSPFIRIHENYFSDLYYAKKYFYSETEPSDSELEYWHYVNDLPAKW